MKYRPEVRSFPKMLHQHPVTKRGP